jgi:hypothetical protein
MDNKKLKIRKPRASKGKNMESTKISNLKEYLQHCPKEAEVFRFDTQEEADDFGRQLKEIARQEEDAPTEFDMQLFDVKITAQTVRICLLQPELVIS